MNPGIIWLVGAGVGFVIGLTLSALWRGKKEGRWE